VSTAVGDFLICPGSVQQIVGDDLELIGPLYTGGSNLDGAPYHGDSEGEHAVIVHDDSAIVVRITAP
jgi:hypothetical protein